MPREVTAVLFEGGNPQSPPEYEMTVVRKAVALDNLEKLKLVREIDRIVFCTNYPDLAEEARSLGATVVPTVGSECPFHFGRVLARIVEDLGIDRVLFMGGASTPLITVGELAEVASRLGAEENVVIMNNAVSADLVAFTPARILQHILLPSSDNFLGYLLREAGLRRILMPNSPRINFDLDTPVDFLVLGLQPDLGPRTRAALSRLTWDCSRLLAAREVLKRKGAEVALIGRVGAPLIAYLNNNFKCRLRVFSEERGMKALGREEKGEVVSLLGYFYQELGPRAFFHYLARTAEAVFFDTRVLFGHLKKGGVSPQDRYYSDLGLHRAVQDPDIRLFTQAAHDAPVPVVLGGHSLVSGGVWLLAEGLLKDHGRDGNSAL